MIIVYQEQFIKIQLKWLVQNVEVSSHIGNLTWNRIILGHIMTIFKTEVWILPRISILSFLDREIQTWQYINLLDPIYLLAFFMHTWQMLLCFLDPTIELIKFPQYLVARTGCKVPIYQPIVVDYGILLGKLNCMGLMMRHLVGWKIIFQEELRQSILMDLCPPSCQ